MLSGYEQVPTAAQWRALGPETLRVLVDLYNDRDAPPYVRLRAVTAASSFPSRAARTFLLAVARLPGQSDLFTREAILSLGRAFGARAIDDVAPFLSSPEPVVREGAALCLGRIGTPAAVEALRRRLTVEGHDNVRRTIARSIERSGR